MFIFDVSLHCMSDQVKLLMQLGSEFLKVLRVAVSIFPNF